MDSKQQKALLQSVRASLLKVDHLKLMHACDLCEQSIQPALAYSKHTKCSTVQYQQA